MGRLKRHWAGIAAAALAALGLALLAAIGHAQTVLNSQLQYTWPNVGNGTATGQLGNYVVLNGVFAARPVYYTVAWTVSGTAFSSLTFNAQGSADGVNWFALDSASPVAATASGAESLGPKPVLYLRIYIQALTGGDGTSKAVFSYMGSSATNSCSSAPCVQSWNGQAGQVVATTANLLTTYTWASTKPTCAAGLLNEDALFSDINGDTLVDLRCKYSTHLAAYLWAPPNGVFVLAKRTVPVAVAPSGSMANNGVITLGTALDATYPSIYLCLPAAAISASSAAGCYYTVMTSATAGTVYNNPYWYTVATLPAAGSYSGPPLWVNNSTSSTSCATGGGTALVSCQVVGGSWQAVGYSAPPQVPAAPTAFSTTGPGAYTGLTSLVQLTATAIQPGLMGPQGQVDIYSTWDNNTTANNKVEGIGWQTLPSSGSGAIASVTQTSTAGYQAILHARNLESASAQFVWQTVTGNGASGIGYKTNATGTSVPIVLEVCTLATATDYCISTDELVELTTP